ncbi:uncharacterized protein LOC116131387 [Pistacia vera]|uniref:uncharacterized protein LOC116131387 n=1 Tax=Pistacia vera TaxID=55513 RepID=UPI001262E237|nr:uncharacterized protein LOC116131387 [Pistacia vera]
MAIKPRSQPSIKSVLARKEAKWRVDMAVARLFYDSCIPINVINSIYFQPMVDAITAIGPGYKIPTYHNLHVNLLRDARKEVQLLVDGYKKTWEDVGCTLMADGWTDNSHRLLINFLVYCPKGLCFVKSVDASDIVKDATILFSLFEEIALWVGPNNIVHLVTNNGANYKVVRRMLSEKYSSTTWSPCAAHCVNFMLKDIAEMSHIVNLLERASELTKFVWIEIIHPGATRFATTFIALSSLHQHKHDLESTVTDRTFVESRCAKTNKDSYERPSIGYVYDGMYRTRMGIKKLFKNRKILYKLYTTIIKMRWDRMLRRDIHAAAYYLNPAFKYDDDTFSKKPEVMYGFLDTIDNKASAFKISKTTLLEESRLYRDRLESFSRELALQTCKTTRPDEWWTTFGFSAPNLQKSCYKKITYNPVDYESIDKTAWWIVDEEEEVGELNYDELEQSLYGEGAILVDGGDHPSYYDSTDASEDDVADVTNDDNHL